MRPRLILLASIPCAVAACGTDPVLDGIYDLQVTGQLRPAVSDPTFPEVTWPDTAALTLDLEPAGVPTMMLLGKPADAARVVDRQRDTTTIEMLGLFPLHLVDPGACTSPFYTEQEPSYIVFRFRDGRVEGNTFIVATCVVPTGVIEATYRFDFAGDNGPP